MNSSECMKCSKCKIEKDRTDFYKSKHSPSGLQYVCKICQSQRQRNKLVIYYRCDICSKNFTRLKKSSKAESERKSMCKSCLQEIKLQKFGGHSHNYTGTKNFAGRLISGWKGSALRRGIRWDLSKDQLDEIFLKQNNKCALSGMDFDYNKRSIYRPSIDRIDSTKEYTYDNIQFVCVIVNIMKNKFSQKEFIDMCKKISTHNLC